MNEKKSTDDSTKSESELDGLLEYYEKKLCGEKLVPLYFYLTKNRLLFFKEKNKKNFFLSIKRDNVLAIRKVQKNIKDLFTFSIFYLEDKNSNEISEIKLKTKSQRDNDHWIKILREKISPKNFFESEFFNNGNNIKISKNYLGGDELFPFKDESEKYLKICHLEYIILIRKIKEFFYIYKKSNTNIDNNENSSEIINSNNDVKDENKDNKNENDNNDNKIMNEKNILHEKEYERMDEEPSIIDGDCGIIIGEKSK